MIICTRRVCVEGVRFILIFTLTGVYLLFRSLTPSSIHSSIPPSVVCFRLQALTPTVTKKNTQTFTHSLTLSLAHIRTKIFSLV